MDSQKEQFRKAVRAMKDLGISSSTVIPVLKRLLKLYNKNWALIEEDNYRTLADAIFESEEDGANEEIEPPLKKQNCEDKALTSNDKGKSIPRVKEDKGEVPKPLARMKKTESHQLNAGHPTNEPHHRVKGSLGVRKNKDLVIKENPNSDKFPDHRVNDPDSHNNGGAIVLWEKQSQSANSSHMCTGSIDPSPSCDEEAGVTKCDRKKAFRTVRDIAKGTEKVKISLIDEIGNEALPHFVYCPENIAYESANVHVSLARIADEDCCSDCKGDCLSSSIPCQCAGLTGGEYAYTVEGFLTQKFLQACISLKLSPNMEHAVYCKDCPLERAKNSDFPGRCQGHISRKFIKECWRKCGCNMRCGNRLVQRGITRKLEVFFTRGGKGWGLRTLEELPQGAFVCEYVGEILTNIELYDRNNRRSADKAGKHFYPVLLDADWSTEENLKDEEALCLDATNYGNVARFINHRCHDGNLIEIPVQVETPDRHYYHIAFFTTRKVDALEELTWDYGIDFFDKNHPIKAFRCNCGSAYCRDKMQRR